MFPSLYVEVMPVDTEAGGVLLPGGLQGIGVRSMYRFLGRRRLDEGGAGFGELMLGISASFMFGGGREDGVRVVVVVVVVVAVCPSADGETYRLSSPHFHVRSYMSSVNISQSHSQSGWFSGVSFGSRDSDSASFPYRRSPLLRQRKLYTTTVL